MVLSIDGTINPATADYLETSLREAKRRNAQLVVLRLNTPGGLLPSMQTMVELILESETPIAVYVSPQGGSAISAGVFVTLAGHFAVMAPGTSIGAAHPVSGQGDDIQGDMRAKVENSAVSLIKGIAEQRGRNAKWAEKAVRESVAVTDREALEAKIIDFVAADLDKLLAELEGKTVNVSGKNITLKGLTTASQEPVEMSFKQKIINILSDPNIAILLGLGALLGLGLELYHPGVVLPGIVGAICLILSLTAAQVLPINYGGVALLLLGAAFFAVELFMPTFGVWGVAGIICFVLGSIYLIDTDLVWGTESLGVDKLLVGSVAGTVGGILLIVTYLVLKSSQRPVSTGKEGLINQFATVIKDFEPDEKNRRFIGKVTIMGEYWNAQSKDTPLLKGARVRVVAIEPEMTLRVEPSN